MTTRVGFFDSDRQELFAGYDGQIRYLGRRIGNIIVTLIKTDVGMEILVITSDHSDLLGKTCVLSHNITAARGIDKPASRDSRRKSTRCIQTGPYTTL